MSDHQHSGPTLIIGLRLIGVVHGVFVGLGGLIPLLYILLGSADQDWRAGLASKIALTLVAAAGFLTMYAFFARKRSGRYLGILCSGLFFSRSASRLLRGGSLGHGDQSLRPWWVLSTWARWSCSRSV